MLVVTGEELEMPLMFYKMITQDFPWKKQDRIGKTGLVIAGICETFLYSVLVLAVIGFVWQIVIEVAK